MLIVYVNHYLTPVGLEYFEDQWFPKVHSQLLLQDGFVSINYNLNKKELDLIEICLKFEDEPTFDAWCDMPAHDYLLGDLDAYRSRSYFEAARTDNPQFAPSKIEWATYQVMDSNKDP